MQSRKGNNSHRMFAFLDLKGYMNEKQATVDQLAETAGVGRQTVQYAKAKRNIHLGLAQCIILALETRTFEYKKCGRKRKGELQWHQQPKGY